MALSNISRDVLVLMSTLEIALANVLGMYSYFWMWRMSINARKWTFLKFCFKVPSLWPPFIPFPLSPFASGINIAWDEGSCFCASRFRRHASPRDRSPESPVPYVTLDSRSSLIRTTFGVHTSFFTGSHLRVSRSPPDFSGYLKNFSHRYTVPRDETTCACFHL